MTNKCISVSHSDMKIDVGTIDNLCRHFTIGFAFTLITIVVMSLNDSCVIESMELEE